MGREITDMDKYCKDSAIWLMIIGVVHLVFPAYLMFEWGIVLILASLFVWTVRTKSVLIISGLLLIFAGLWNIVSPLVYGEDLSLWMVFGFFQMVLGGKSIKTFFNIGKTENKKKNKS